MNEHRDGLENTNVHTRQFSRLIRRLSLALVAAALANGPIIIPARGAIYNTAAQLATRSGQAGATHQILGYANAGDGGAGTFSYMGTLPAWTTGTNAVVIAAPGGGYWVRQDTSLTEWSLSWWGVGPLTGTNDVSAAISSAHNVTLAAGRSLRFPEGTYHVETPLWFRAAHGTVWKGSETGQTTLKTTGLLHPVTGVMIQFSASSNVFVQRIVFEGRGPEPENLSYSLLVFGQGARRAEIRDCVFRFFRHSGLRFITDTNNVGIRIRGCQFLDGGYHPNVDAGGGLMAYQYDDLQIEQCYVRNVGWTDKLHGFYLAGSSSGKSRTLRITDTVFNGIDGPYFRSHLTINETIDAVVSRCTFINNRNTIRNDDGLMLTQSLLTNAVLVVGSNAKIVQNAFYLDSSGVKQPGYGGGTAIDAYAGRVNVLIEDNIVTGLNPSPTFTTPFVQMTSGSLTNWVIRNNYVANRMLLYYSTTGAGNVCSQNWAIYPNYNAGYRGLIDYRAPGLSIIQNTLQTAPAGAALSDAKSSTPVDAKWGNVILQGLVFGLPDTTGL